MFNKGGIKCWILSVVLLVVGWGSASGQVAEIDTGVLNRGWPSAGGLFLSGDGKYAACVLEGGSGRVLEVMSLEGPWKHEEAGAGMAEFAGGDRCAVVAGGDSVVVLELGGTGRRVMRGVREHMLLGRKGVAWMLCGTGLGDTSLLLWEELSTGRQERYGGVVSYRLSGDSTKLAWVSREERGRDTDYVLREEALGSGEVREIRRSRGVMADGVWLNGNGGALLYGVRAGTEEVLHWYEWSPGRDREIWRGVGMTDCRFDGSGGQAVFMTDAGVMYCKRGGERAALAAGVGTPGIGEGLEVDRGGGAGFTGDGLRIYFYLSEKQQEAGEAVRGMGTGVLVDVWHYRDGELQSEQLSGGRRRRRVRSWLAVRAVDLSSGVVRIEGEGYSARDIDQARGYVLLVRGSGPEWWWKPEERMRVSLVSLEDGRRALQREVRYNPQDALYTLSPDGRYLVYYDPYGRSYRSYEPSTGRDRALGAGLGVCWELSEARDRPYPDPVFGSSRSSRGLCGWEDSSRRVLVYSDHDIWSLDPSGSGQPRNLTGGSGGLGPVRYTLRGRAGGTVQVWGDGYCGELRSGEELVLQGVNERTKEAGVYLLSLKAGARLRVLLRGGYAAGGSELVVKKALHGPWWAVLRSSEGSAPNWYVTEDFRAYRAVTAVSPQTGYRWYRTELVSWRLPGGGNCQGVLFKPEDMDSTRRYPVLINYYETSSGGMHHYSLPAWLGAADVNVPYFVSRGYLVFMPDIHIRVGYPGRSALESVESGARYLMKRRYVDGGHMAVLGHSYGGFETNYIVTHSGLFAAAAESAGVTDLISAYGSVLTGGASPQWGYETYQGRMGVTPWERPGLYGENSAVLSAARMRTPLLMLHNKLDDAVPWQQGMELFTALRRLGRRVWLLQYDGEEHVLSKRENQRDYTIRLTEFLDHYLKGTAAPVWMTEGIDARWKGLRSGYEADRVHGEP